MVQAGLDGEEFASALKQRRASAGLSRDELASAVGVSSSTIKALELGARSPSKELSRKLRRVLDIEPESGTTDAGSVLNCWIAPGFSALGLLDGLIASVNGPGGSQIGNSLVQNVLCRRRSDFGYRSETFWPSLSGTVAQPGMVHASRPPTMEPKPWLAVLPARRLAALLLSLRTEPVPANLYDWRKPIGC